MYQQPSPSQPSKSSDTSTTRTTSMATSSKHGDSGLLPPRESGETDTGSVFRDTGSTSVGSLSFDQQQQNDWIGVGSTGIAVDQVLKTNYESTDSYNEETVNADTWAEGNFSFEYRRQQGTGQSRNILALNESKTDAASSLVGSNRRPSAAVSLNRHTSQGSASSEADDADELNNRLKNMGIGYGKTTATSSAPSYPRPNKVSDH